MGDGTGGIMVGIDFGTSTSEAAYVDGKGRLVMVPNHEGALITPSAVHIAEDGTVTVGREAKERALLEPGCTFLEVKRLFGKQAKLRAWGKEYAPADIAAMLIKYLVGCAERHSGREVREAVITVPAYFTDGQRREIIAAGSAAGLEVRRILNEPTAASLDYGADHMEECRNVLVYDLGGGTLDVTVLELFEGVVDVRATRGNSELGGKDFDEALAAHLRGLLKKESGADAAGDPRAMMRLKMAAEECKMALSEGRERAVALPFLAEKGGAPVGLEATVTRELFEGLIRGMVMSTKAQVDAALGDAGLAPADVDLVLLVGGSTRVPLVRDFLEDEYGFSPESAVDADLAVVRGAAVQAGVLSGAIGGGGIVLTDVCPHSLSAASLTADSEHRGDLRCKVIIPRNTVLPAERAETFFTAADNQTTVLVTAYQGESDMPDDNTLLGSFMMTGIPRARASKEAINIKFAYDLNGILNIGADVVSTGKSADITVDAAQAGDADLSAWKKSPLAGTYRRLLNRADRLAKLRGRDARAVSAAAERLKRGLVLGWDGEALRAYADYLESDIEDLLEDEGEGDGRA